MTNSQLGYYNLLGVCLTLVSRQCAEHKEQDYQRYPKYLIQVYHSHDFLY